MLYANCNGKIKNYLRIYKRSIWIILQAAAIEYLHFRDSLESFFCNIPDVVVASILPEEMGK